MWKLSKEKSVKEAKASVAKTDPIKTVRPSAARAHRILVKPLVSEKAAHLASQDTYAFVVNIRANKIEVAKAFWATYNIKPVAVRMVIAPEKTKRTGRNKGVRSAWKKALIRVPAGSKVDIFTGV
ncbi:MAG: 50S ribosomal protein L23 [Candidatus Komeilibacteria bacterium]|nr:50S ribosomal protein L23 [Candidatus Komeilibacteria bacterium]